MERLTTNKDVQEMGMYELAHNCSYYKDGNARYRDFDMDMDARDFARNLMITLANDELPNDDDEFDEEILENLQYDQFSDVKGLIALFYRNLWAMADLRETLKTYEDDEEQGLLLWLPCKVGDNVYKIWSCGKNGKSVAEFRISHIDIDDLQNIEFAFISTKNISTSYWFCKIGDFGKTVFLTKEEAELALANMKDERNGR